MGGSEGAEIHHCVAKGRELKTGTLVRSANTSVCHKCHYQTPFSCGQFKKMTFACRV